MRSFFWKHFGLYAPKIELKRFKQIEFFPPHPVDLEKMDSICIGSKSRTIGDPLMLSTLPAKLKAKHPHLQIYAYPRGFNPAVFLGNPAISGIQYLPDRLYGDDCNWGEGHLIQLKERFFDLPVSSDPRPEIHLLPSESAWIDRYLKQHSQPVHSGKPLCVIHPWGRTRSNVLSREVWEQVVRRLEGSLRFWQVGIEGQVAIAGCEHHFLTPKAFRHSRKLFALLSRAELFVGVDSGPMHVTRAFQVPSLILTDIGIPAKAIFEQRAAAPYYLHRNWTRSFLYEANEHLDVALHSSGELAARISAFLERKLMRMPHSS